MDAELAALIEEQKRQAQMLKDLGLMDDDEETPQEEEQEQTELAELDQMLNEPEPIKPEEPKQEPQEEVKEACTALDNSGFGNEVRLELLVFSRNPKDTIEPQKVIKSASGRTFIDLGNRVFATNRVDNPQDLAKDLLDIAAKKDWDGFSIKGASSYSEVYKEAFRYAINSGLKLLPDPASRQAPIAIEISREIRSQSDKGRLLVAAYAKRAMDNAAMDARKDERKTILEKLKSAITR